MQQPLLNRRGRRAAARAAAARALHVEATFAATEAAVHQAKLRRQVFALAENASAHGALAESRAKGHRLRQQLAETAAEQAPAEAELKGASVEIHECIREVGGDAFV